MTPAPPRHGDGEKKERRHPEKQSDGSVRAAFDHSPPKRTRTRLDSTGSTRGAFYTPSKEQVHVPRTRKKKSPKKSQPKSDLSSNAQAMGEMASLAMEGLDGSDIGSFLGGSSPLKEKRPARTKAVSEPIGLETIMDGYDDSEDLSSQEPMYARRSKQRPSSRRVLASTRAQQSEQSLDLNALSSGMPYRNSAFRGEESMQYSAAPFDSQNVNFLAHLRSDDVPLSMRSTESTGLHGMDIPLSMRTADTMQQQPWQNSNIMVNDYNNVEVSLPSHPQNVQWYPPTHSQQQREMAHFSSLARQEDVSNFSTMAQAGYGSTLPPPSPTTFQQPPPPPRPGFADKQSSQLSKLSRTLGSELNEDDDDDDDVEDEESYYSEEQEKEIKWQRRTTFTGRLYHFVFLSDVTHEDSESHPIYPPRGWTIPSQFRHYLFNPEFPEFTSLQQFNWAVILGVVMGFYTAIWKNIIERGVDLVWQTIPGKLHHWGVFTSLDGAFPMPHYMWICPAIFGGILSYIFVILPNKIPGQNEWIQALHARGVQDHETFWPLWILSTLGMMSGLSLGPELPLVLTAGMVGSWLGVICKQSMLQARVMNITAASAAVGGFFGFPMAGAMFVLEIPHRMGLQYFEALSPATIASIVAVLVNRMIVNNDVTGYYNYPFLTASLPSHIFTTAIIYGLVGSVIGVIYAEGVMFLKHWVHDLFNTHAHPTHEESDENHGDATEHDAGKQQQSKNGAQNGELIPLVVHTASKHDGMFDPHENESFFERIGFLSKNILSFGIKHEPTRAAVAGTLAGLIVGVTCMFVPHVTFWGEAQLQTLIDKGRTPLPVFGEEHKSTEDLTAWGFCVIDPKDPSEVAAGFSIGCAALITSAKIFVTGLSLGTGIIGGHFWGPLFVGCAASHLLTDLANLMQRSIGFGEGLAAYPCVSILCMMGSTHVVTFRAHMAIMLILTLTISAFDQGDSSGTGYTAGDYSAVFPLLVVSVFVSLMISRGTVFYAAQRSRGDIMALPEVLCEPGKAGAPMIIDYAEGDYGSYFSQSYIGSQEYSDYDDDSASSGERQRRSHINKIKADDIEREFSDRQQGAAISRSDSEYSQVDGRKTGSSSQHQIPEPDVPFMPKVEIYGHPVLPRPSNAVPDGRSTTLTVGHDEHPSIYPNHASAEDFDLPSSKLNELLDEPLEPRYRPPRKGHRRIHSAPTGVMFNLDVDTAQAGPSRSPRHRRLDSMGGNSIRERSDSTSSSRAGTPTGSVVALKKITSFGEVAKFQPSLLEQARARASSMHKRTGSGSMHRRTGSESMHRRTGSNASLSRFPRSRGHSRQNSNASVSSNNIFSAAVSGDVGGSLVSPSNVSPHVAFSEPTAAGDLSQEDVDLSYSKAATGFRSPWTTQ